MKKILKNSKKELYKVFLKELTKKYSIKDLCSLWNIHKGTINRWVFKQEVPLNYFNHINKLLKNKYFLDTTKEEYFKNMDQFFTPTNIAIKLINETVEFIENNWDINLKDYTLIEPSAGSGSFYFSFPKNKFKNLIAMDIEPQNKKIEKYDWFEYAPESNKNIVIGNPPFGLRGQLALQFINHASHFCDFICFILPPLFNSNGKGSPMLRVNKDFYLAKEISINNKDFFYPDGKKTSVNSIYQIWTNKFSSKVKPIQPPKKTSEWVKIYSLSNGNTSSSKRNVEMIGNCDYYLPSTTYNKISLEKKFENLPNNRGYGIVILKERKKIMKIIENINWEKVGFKSTNSANNLRSQLIINVIEMEINNAI